MCRLIENQLTGLNAGRIKARLVVEGANGPTTPEADEILYDRGVFVVPDILSQFRWRATVSYFEWVQGLQEFFWSEDEINDRLERIMSRSFASTLELAVRERISMHGSISCRGPARVADATLMRGIYP